MLLSNLFPQFLLLHSIDQRTKSHSNNNNNSTYTVICGKWKQVKRFVSFGPVVFIFFFFSLLPSHSQHQLKNDSFYFKRKTKWINIWNWWTEKQNRNVDNICFVHFAWKWKQRYVYVCVFIVHRSFPCREQEE